MTGFRCGTVALIGWTNVGKSTLLNRMVGEKLAAVANVPQTTRTRITGVITRQDKGQIVFVDTPGFHQPRHRMNRTMVRVARETLRHVDIAVQVIDAASGLGPGDRRIADSLREHDVPAVAALNKVDRVQPKSKLLPMMEQLGAACRFEEVFPISALTGEGCDALLEHLITRLPLSDPLFPDDYLTDQPERALAAEMIREKLLGLTRQEIPHATAVAVEHWDAADDNMLRIHATVYVEKESQKPIVIGRAGQLLKAVGSAARLELEGFFGTRVALKLWVRVQPGWRDDRRTLERLGLH